jgi:hypothetical protein
MSVSFRSVFGPAARLLLTGALLAGCSSPNSTTAADAVATADSADASAPSPPTFPFGSKIDSLAGVAGHKFGEPLSAFPKLRLLPAIPGVPVGPTRTYTSEETTSWFGKHRAQVPTQLYSFLDGKFCAFVAIGAPAVLRPEASYLFGPGQAQGQYQFFWEGSRARAVYAEKAAGFGREGRLDVLSKPYEAELAARASAKLKAENAQ